MQTYPERSNVSGCRIVASLIPESERTASTVRAPHYEESSRLGKGTPNPDGNEEMGLIAWETTRKVSRNEWMRFLPTFGGTTEVWASARVCHRRLDLHDESPPETAGQIVQRSLRSATSGGGFSRGRSRGRSVRASRSLDRHSLVFDRAMTQTPIRTVARLTRTRLENRPHSVQLERDSSSLSGVHRAGSHRLFLAGLGQRRQSNRSRQG